MVKKKNSYNYRLQVILWSFHRKFEKFSLPQCYNDCNDETKPVNLLHYEFLFLSSFSFKIVPCLDITAIKLNKINIFILHFFFHRP